MIFFDDVSFPIQIYSRIPFYESVKGNVKGHTDFAIGFTCNVLKAAYLEKWRESEKEAESYEKYDAICVSWAKNCLLLKWLLEKKR